MKYIANHSCSNTFFNLVSNEPSLDAGLIVIVTKPDMVEETISQCKYIVSGYALKSKGFGITKYAQNDFSLLYSKE